VAAVRSIVGIVQIESARAVTAAEEIAAIEGVDVPFVGPRDPSHDLGGPGQTTAPVFVDALERVRLASRKHGKACGLLVADGAAAAVKMAEGWTLVTIDSDSTLLATAATAQLARARTRG
jgi:4-hydroxy-2-oxoheptanedioate aldolase